MICIWHCFACGMGLYQHEPLDNLARFGDECWYKPITHGKQCHMYFLAR